MIDRESIYEALRTTSPGPERGERALTFIENEIWHKTAGLGPQLARLTVAASLRGPLDEGRFCEAFDLVASRHDTFWTQFRCRGGEPIAILDPATRATLAVTQAASREAAIDQLCVDQAAGFHLEVEAPIRCRLVRVSADEHYLCVLAHHIALDYWSIMLMSRELCAAYEALVAGTPPLLRPLRAHNRDLSSWQAAWYVGETRARYEDYWRAQWGKIGAPARAPLRELSDRSGRLASHPRAIVVGKFDASLGALLADVALGHGASFAELLLASFAVLLRAESDDDELVIGSLVANRHRETIAIIGNLVTMLPLRIEMPLALTFVELLGQVHERIEAMTLHADAPPAVSDPRRAVEELYRVVFNCVSAPTGELFQPKGLTAERLPLPPPPFLCQDLVPFVVVCPDHGVNIQLDYNADLISAARADGLIVRWSRLLGRIASEPTQTIGALNAFV